MEPALAQRLVEFGIIVFTVVFLFWSLMSFPVGYYKTYRVRPLLISFVVVSFVGSLLATFLMLFIYGRISRDIMVFIICFASLGGSILFGGKVIFPRLWVLKSNAVPLQPEKVESGEVKINIVTSLVWLIIAPQMGDRFLRGQPTTQIVIFLLGLFVFPRTALLLWRRYKKS